MWSKEFNSSDNEWGDSSTYHYKSTDHPKHFDFTIDEVVHIGHDSGTAGTHWYLSVRKDIGNGRTRLFYGIGIHVADWCKLFKREIHRLRNNEPLKRTTMDMKWDVIGVDMLWACPQNKIEHGKKLNKNEYGI